MSVMPGLKKSSEDKLGFWGSDSVLAWPDQNGRSSRMQKEDGNFQHTDMNVHTRQKFQFLNTIPGTWSATRLALAGSSYSLIVLVYFLLL